MSSKNISWGKRRTVLRAGKTYHLHEPMVLKFGNLKFLQSSRTVQACNEITVLLLLILNADMFYHMYYSSSQHTAIYYPWRTVEFTRSDYQGCTYGWNPSLLWSKKKHGGCCGGRLRTSNRFQQHHNRVVNLGYSRSHWITKVWSIVLIVKIVYCCFYV